MVKDTEETVSEAVDKAILQHSNIFKEAPVSQKLTKKDRAKSETYLPKSYREKEMS